MPGSVRILLDSTSTVGHAPMEAGAFLRPDGLVALVVLNRGPALSATTDYTVQVADRKFVNMAVPAHSMQVRGAHALAAQRSAARHPGTSTVDGGPSGTGPVGRR